MAVRLLSQSVAAALALPLVWLPRASADSNQLKAVVFEDVKPLYQKTDSGYEGLGVEILEQIRTQASRGEIHYRVAKSVKDGLNAVITGQVDIACGVAFTWGRSSQLSYTLPFGLGGTRLLTTTTTVDGTASSLNEETVGVVKDSASNKILKSVVPGVTLKVFDTPGQALAAFNTGAVQTLAGHPLWLAANSNPHERVLLPLRPYDRSGRSGIGCIVNQNNGKLLSDANRAIGQMMQAYLNGDAGTRHMVNRWIGPGTNVGMKQAAIRSIFSSILSITGEFSTADALPHYQNF